MSGSNRFFLLNFNWNNFTFTFIFFFFGWKRCIFFHHRTNLSNARRRIEYKTLKSKSKDLFIYFLNGEDLFVWDISDILFGDFYKSVNADQVEFSKRSLLKKHQYRIFNLAKKKRKIEEENNSYFEAFQRPEMPFWNACSKTYHSKGHALRHVGKPNTSNSHPLNK